MSEPVILHPTDFSAHADHAFALARSLARGSGGRLVVLHAMPLQMVQTKRGYREEMQAALRLRREEGDRPEVEYRLEEGEAASSVLRVAAEVSAELVVMGTLGRTGLGRLLMGSVAEEVILNARCPVVAVRASPVASALAATVPIRTILHPTDFSEPCEEAFRVACSLARDHAAEVIVVHVPEPPAGGSGMSAPPPFPEGHRGGLEARLCGFQKRTPDVRVGCRVEEGEPAVGITRAAAATACDLIVMGTHGRTGWRRLIMGSVAQDVLRQGGCPVLTVRSSPPAAT